MRQQTLKWLCVMACAVQWSCSPQLISLGPPIAGPYLSTDALITADGARLFLRTWTPEENPRAILIALHGFNDYSNAFADAGVYWSSRDIMVYAYDQRGFGSNEQAGQWPGLGTLVNDLSQAIRVIGAAHPDQPLYLIGESMGGAVAMTALARSRLKVRGVILVAPAVWGRETMNRIYPLALWLGAHTFPWVKLSGQGLGFKPSDNNAMLIALGEDPLVIKKTRIDALYGIVNLMDAALEAAPSIRAPMLVLYGAQDEIIPKAATGKMLARLSGSPRIVIYPDGYHLLLRDLSAEVVLADISAWITGTDGKLPSGYSGEWQLFFEQ